MSNVLAWILLLAPLASILAMLVFMLARRWRRGRWLRRRDILRRNWLEILPSLLAGKAIPAGWLATRDSRETLERLLMDRLAVATSEEAVALRGVLEREGFIDRHLDWLRRGKHWQKLESAALLGAAGAKTAVPPLAELLQYRSGEIRNAAARALAAIGDAVAAPALLEQARRTKIGLHPTMWLRAVVACRVPHDSLAELLHDDRAEIRTLAARATAEMPQPVRVETIERFVFDPDAEVRAQMARALGRSADARAAPLLAALARDTEWFVRLRAQAAMGQLNRRECLDSILYGTRDPNFQVRARAAEALSRMALDPADVLAVMLKAGDRYALEAYVTLLGRSGHLWRTLSLLRARDPIVRAKAEELIGAVVSAGVTQEFVYALEVHPDRRVRARLARLLARHADAGALFAPIDRLRKRASDRRQLRVLNWLARESTHVLADRV